jgi:hypothetical protein
MILLRNPLALWGLLTLAIPVAIHLMARRRSRIVRLPNLGFLPPLPPSATRALELDDRKLLALRMGVLTAAVLALAGPLFLTPLRESALAGPGVRVLIADAASTDPEALALAVAEARAEAESAGQTLEVVTTSDLLQAVAGAGAWLGPQPGVRQLVLFSAFPYGSLPALEDATLTLAGVPDGVGVQLVRVAPRSTPAPAFREGSWRGVPRGIEGEALSDFRTVARWRLDGPGAGAGVGAGVASIPGTSAPGPLSDALPPPVLEAAGRLGGWDLPEGRVLRILPPGTDAELGAAEPGAGEPGAGVGAAPSTETAGLPAPWMADLLLGLWRDPLVGEAMASGAVGWTPRFLASDTLALILGPPGGSDREPTPAAWGPLAVALLVAAGAVEPEGAPHWAGDPVLLPDAILEGFQREAGDAGPAPRLADPFVGPSDARILWALALLLLGAEGVYRRRLERRREMEETP